MDRFCEVCGMGEMVLGETSTLYCRNCGAQSNQFIEEAFDADDAHMFTATFVREKGTIRNAERQQPQPSMTPGSARYDILDSAPDVQEVIRLTQQGTQSTPFATVKTEDLSQVGSQFGLDCDPIARMTKEEVANAIRKSYLGGLQKILHLQLECLVKEFGVTPLICGIAGPVWLRFVASTRVLESTWAEEAVTDSELRSRTRRENQAQSIRRENQAEPPNEGDAPEVPKEEVAPAAPGEGDAGTEKKKRKRVKKEGKRKGAPGPRTAFGRPLSDVWLTALKESIPLATTLAVCYLSCYIAREPILPLDLKKWAGEGRLPYLAAFVEISKSAPRHIPNTVGERQIFPMKPRLMFQPLRLNAARYLELLAGFVAERVGVQLPPVNFHAICALFLRDLGLKAEQLLLYACRLYDWYTPAGLFLSSRRRVFPIRIYVMAMLIIAMKILYNLDGRPLQQENEEEKEPERKKRRRTRRTRKSPPKNEEGTPQTMLTRARAKAKASGAEACVAEDRGVQMGEVVPQDGPSAAPDGQSAGKRKRSTASSEDGAGGGEARGEDERILGGASAARIRKGRWGGCGDVRWEIHDAKELLDILEAVKTPSPVNFDEELAKYLQYCRDVIFTGRDCDPGMEPVIEFFRGIYEKHMTKVRSQPGVHSDDEASAAGEGNDKKPTAQAGPSRTAERAESLDRDVPSAGSSRTAGCRRTEASAQTKDPKGKAKVTQAHDHVSAPAVELDDAPTETLDAAAKCALDMVEAGFCRLPPIEHHMRWDEYARYTFQQPSSSEQGLVPVHEAYFRVLRACGNLIKVHPTALHWCVQRVEKGLLQTESNVEQFLLGEKGADVAALANAVGRRKPVRRRDKMAGAENARAAAARTRHVRDLSYL